MIRLSELKLNEANPRVIKDDKFKKLVESIKSFPQMMELRPIVVDEMNVIQGGNMRYRALVELGYKEVQEAWVKQGKDLTPEQWREFVIKDNVGFGEWDFEMLANDWDAEELQEWGLDLPVSLIEEEGTKIDDEYTKKIKSPVYEIKNEKPEIVSLYDDSRVKELEAKINNTELPEDIKTFLMYAAQRHRVFNYELIADFYAHSEKPIQELMEDSALVIIDFNKAIELGYVKLSEEVALQYSKDYEE